MVIIKNKVCRVIQMNSRINIRVQRTFYFLSFSYYYVFYRLVITMFKPSTVYILKSVALGGRPHHPTILPHSCEKVKSVFIQYLTI